MPQLATPQTRPIIRWSYGGQDYSYAVTPEDSLWWARAIWREGAPQIAVGHALLQRFAYLYSTNAPYKTLTSFLRAYCQPINPEWFPGGKLSTAKITRLTKAGDSAGAAAERAKAQQRLVYSQTPLSQIPTRYREIAEQILAGATSSPIPGAMHFTSSFAARSDSPETAKQKALAFAKKRNLEVVPTDEGFQKGVNWFFALPGKVPPQLSISSIARASLIPLSVIGLLIAFLIFGKRRAR